MMWIADPCLHADIGKRAVAIVVEKVIGLAVQSPRPAAYRDTAILAEREHGCIRAGARRGRQIVVNVAGNEEIEAAIAVIVAEAGAGRPVPQRDTCLLGHIGKGAIVIVVVEPVLAEVGDVEVGPPIVVVVPY